MFPGSYHISFFACCREIYDPSNHTGCAGGTREEAVAYFEAEAQELIQRKKREEHKEIAYELALKRVQ